MEKKKKNPRPTHPPTHPQIYLHGLDFKDLTSLMVASRLRQVDSGFH